MSQISKCPKLRVVLGYWEALGEVSEMRYNNLLYSSSKRSYCSRFPPKWEKSQFRKKSKPNEIGWAFIESPLTQLKMV